MGVSEYGLQQEQGPYKTVAQIWEEAAQQGSKYRTLTAKHRYNIVKDAAGDNFISKSDLKKVKTLGKGSFGTVDVCKYQGGLVAVKSLSPTSSPDSQENLEDFAKEALLLQSLQHRSILKYIGYGHDKPEARDNEVNAPPNVCAYLVTEYVDGKTLKNKVLEQMVTPNKSIYTAEQAMQWLGQIADALAYMHALNPTVVHRDLKLENILLRDEHGTLSAVLSDFGLHTLLQKSGLHSPSPDTTIHTFARSHETGVQQGRSSQLDKVLMDASYHRPEASRRAGTAYLNMQRSTTFDLTGQTGSYMYMAPEVLMDHKYNEQVDVFSFGVIIYELLARQVTSAVVSQAGDMTMPEMYAQKVANGYRRPIPDNWPSAIRTLVASCWAEQPSQRPKMTLVAKTLANVLQQPNEMGKLALGARGNSGKRMSASKGTNSKGCCAIM